VALRALRQDMLLLRSVLSSCREILGGDKVKEILLLAYECIALTHICVGAAVAAAVLIVIL
jgi:hypothetical protein